MEEHMKITDTIIEPPVYGYKFPQTRKKYYFLTLKQQDCHQMPPLFI